MAGRTPAASPDHHQAHLIAEASRFYSQLTKWDERFDDTAPYRVPHLVYAPAPFDAEQRQWHSSFIVDVSDVFEQKLEAIRCYESQFDVHRFDKVRHWIGAYNATQGGRCGYVYGELFTLPQPVAADDLVRLVRAGKSGPAPVELPGRDHLPQG
jgi:LmbE family N-acetylglucosaminyl deacetylase